MKVKPLLIHIQPITPTLSYVDFTYKNNTSPVNLGKHIKNKISPVLSTRQVYRTPGTLGFTVVCPVTPEEQIGLEGQKVYHSAVRSLLYLVKYSCPDIANNTVHELSKCMDKATPAVFKEMKCVMRFGCWNESLWLKLTL
jgi:hypothetical protein